MNIDKLTRSLFAINVYQSQGPREAAAVGQTKEVAEARSKAAQRPDAVALSERMKDLQKIREVLDSVPEVREDRVRALEGQVRSGAYRVPAEKLASRLLGSR